MKIIDIVRPLFSSRVFRFLIVGVICSAIEFTSFTVFVKSLAVPYLTANILSIVLAICINYGMSRTFVFQASLHKKQTEIMYFILFSGMAILLNQFIIWFLAEKIVVNLLISKVIAIILVAVFNYLTKKKIVFKN